MPKRLIAQSADLFSKFIRAEAFSGILLITMAVAALIWTNLDEASYVSFWQQPVTIGFGDFVLSKPFLLWINDGLMAFFFFVVGLEIKRELIAGELATWRKASLPMFAALGGMVIPALVFVSVNLGSAGVDGWGIPMATDIAFSLGVLALLGRRVPLSLKIFLTALAIVDDIGAVLVIALFYSSEISLGNLLLGVGFLGLMWIMNLAGERRTLLYAIVGIVGVWLAFLLSGVHATIAGVLAAFAIPASTKISPGQFRDSIRDLVSDLKSDVKTGQLLSKESQSIVLSVKDTCAVFEAPLQSLEHSLHPWVVYLVMPLFALSNAGVILGTDVLAVVVQPLGLGIILGLVLGKIVGIVGFSWIASRFGWATLPEGIRWVHVAGAAALAGIGFTMSLFITGLAFTDSDLIVQAKTAVLVASLVAGLLGYMILRLNLREEFPIDR